MTNLDVPNEPGWTLVGGVVCGDDVPGIPYDLWGEKWEDTDERIPMKDPLYGNQLYLRVCRIATPDGQVTFAQYEVSNGVFLLAVPRVP